MIDKLRPLIVIPAWNESKSISSVISEVISLKPNFACLVVDDGSYDQTSSIARKAGAEVLTLPINLGVGGAMRAGFRFAVDNGFDCVVQVDADGQHDPKFIPELLGKLSNADLVIGARFAGKGDYDVSGPRKWAMQFLSKLLTFTTKSKLNDTTSGFRAIGPKALRIFAFDYPAEYLGDTVEALVMASRAGCRIIQVPVVMRKRSAGIPSQNPLKSAMYLGRAVLALVVAYLRPRIHLDIV